MTDLANLSSSLTGNAARVYRWMILDQDTDIDVLTIAGERRTFFTYVWDDFTFGGLDKQDLKTAIKCLAQKGLVRMTGTQKALVRIA